MSILADDEVCPAVDCAVGVAVVLVVDRPVPLPALPGPPVNVEALLSAVGYQSPGR